MDHKHISPIHYLQVHSHFQGNHCHNIVWEGDSIARGVIIGDSNSHAIVWKKKLQNLVPLIGAVKYSNMRLWTQGMSQQLLVTRQPGCRRRSLGLLLWKFHLRGEPLCRSNTRTWLHSLSSINIVHVEKKNYITNKVSRFTMVHMGEWLLFQLKMQSFPVWTQDLLCLAVATATHLQATG